MKKRKKLSKRKVWCIFLLFIAFIYVSNSSFLAKERSGKPVLLAHRGLAQTFRMEGITNDTCTAERIDRPEHSYLENTLPSMEAAFAAGADIAELDIKPTKDGKFAVFHDWTLDCRTNGTGMTKDYTMAELKKLDIGYGYTADHGKTYPFRGKGIGLMPSLDEVLERFPHRSLLIHIKSNDPHGGVQLAGKLAELPQKRLNKLTVYGGDEPIAALKKELPSLRVMSKEMMKSCLIPYMSAGWTGFIPGTCKHTQLHIPEKITPWLWGWPDRFLNRMDKANTRVIVTGESGSHFSSGFDTPEDIKRLPEDYTGGIWTNRIDRIAPLYEK
ncbi:glycerophosphodiester phosphodiesterase family protein [Bacillus swezeyi]|uniref:Glycerophosphodiester phosphodiesterase n=1 Tax=Bacillus swezeyi TaxID=1925020 RepID=A0A5M8RPX6_9BACI|nr:glycerophosphodiester phosphodiesterase family protein [Bacillus swezeyi]KAA6449588.1 glycerophosphodiester phosphodiesterase [Bacillus swezeyi]TYS33604.1 glycerophosphodiester phosphodiesterase [Bacillus swezeyi]